MTLIERLASTATANADCAAVRNSSSRCNESSGSPWSELDEIAKTIGRLPTSSVHWLTFDETSAPSAELVLRRQANSPAIRSSGASDASGASHCTSRNSSMPNCEPVSTSASANPSALARITPAANAEHRGRRRSRRVRWLSSPISSAGPMRCGASAGAFRSRNRYATKSPISTTESKSVSDRFNGRVNE